jgi:DNA-binding response OmpR family regulator
MTTKAIKKILCVEDDCESAALIREELLERGFRVAVAHDGEEGLAAIVREWPDLVLCDIRMPGISGFEVLRRLRERAPPLNRVRFVFISGWSGRDVEFEARRLGADNYVIKPIDFDTLTAIITGCSAGQPGRLLITDDDRRSAVADPGAGSRRTPHVVPSLAYNAHHREE